MTVGRLPFASFKLFLKFVCQFYIMMFNFDDDLIFNTHGEFAINNNSPFLNVLLLAYPILSSGRVELALMYPFEFLI